jgi:hypothetical protein
MNNIFNNNFYYVAKAPNAEELIDFVSKVPVDNKAKIKWNERCNVDVIGLNNQTAVDMINPCIIKFLDHVGDRPQQLWVEGPWMNQYNKYGYQDIHAHGSHHFAINFISNTGEDFADFYFYDKNTAEIPDVVKNYLKMVDIHTPKLEAGDFIVFPSHLLHGVTMHKSDVPRRTLSTNFSIDIQTHSMHT